MGDVKTPSDSISVNASYEADRPNCCTWETIIAFEKLGHIPPTRSEEPCDGTRTLVATVEIQSITGYILVAGGSCVGSFFRSKKLLQRKRVFT